MFGCSSVSLIVKILLLGIKKVKRLSTLNILTSLTPDGYLERHQGPAFFSINELIVILLKKIQVFNVEMHFFLLYLFLGA